MYPRKRLTKIESQSIDRLQTELDDRLTAAWATIAHRDEFEVHRGAWKVSRNECVIFGNDGFSTDVRARIEVAQLVQELERLGIEIKGFGVSEDDGYTWALRVAFKDDRLLDSLVWHIWFVVSSGMEKTPVSAELNRRLTKLKPIAAA